MKTLIILKLSISLFAICILSGCQTIGEYWVGNYSDPYHRIVSRIGFKEKPFAFERVNLLYYEGPNNGPSLVLLHAQMMDWFDYSRVIPDLAKSYHIYVVDYNGHGKTTAPTATMTANSIGAILSLFIETIIKEPVFISGNSSGGLLTAWLAANKPEIVRAIILEDPPLFSSEYPRVKETIAYRSFTSCHNYIAQDSKEDFLTFWIKSNFTFIAKNAGKNAAPRLLSAIETYRNAHPGEPVELRFLPDMMRMVIRGLSVFSPDFGNAFYTGTWNEDFNHAEILRRIECPVLLLQADFEILPDGTLTGAMDQKDAERAMSLLKTAKFQKIKASHIIHLDKPKEYILLVNNFFLPKMDSDLNSILIRRTVNSYNKCRLYSSYYIVDAFASG